MVLRLKEFGKLRVGGFSQPLGSKSSQITVKSIGTPRGVHRTQASQSELAKGLVFLRAIPYDKVLADSPMRNAGLGEMGQSLSY